MDDGQHLPLHRIRGDRSCDRVGGGVHGLIAPFEYHEPHDLPEALHILATYGPDAHAIAGGIALVLLMRQGLVRPAHVVSLRGLAELRGIARERGVLTLGALTAHRAVETSLVVREHCAALAEAFSHIATIRIRNQGTLGGNLAHADPAQDPPPMLLALDAELQIVSAAGERTIPMDGFFTDVFTTTLEEGELIRSVRVPALPARARATYMKFLPRTEDDYATVSVAAVMALDETGRCTHARIALGAVGSTALRARDAEEYLTGRLVDPSAITEAAALAAGSADPFDDLRGSASYKREMIRVWTARALGTLTGES